MENLNPNSYGYNDDPLRVFGETSGGMQEGLYNKTISDFNKTKTQLPTRSGEVNLKQNGAQSFWRDQRDSSQEGRSSSNAGFRSRFAREMGMSYESQ